MKFLSAIALLSFTLCTQAAFSSRQTSAKLDDERQVLTDLSLRFEKFQESANAADDEFRRLRSLVLRGQLTRATTSASTAKELSRLAARRWLHLEKLYDEAISAGLDLLRQGHRTLALAPEFKFYLAFRKNDRFGTGTPMSMLIAAWRGLREGTKLDDLPNRLRRRATIAGIKLESPDSLLIMTIHGGLIRGRFEGMIGDEIVIREVLPSSLRIIQRSHGTYRTFNLDDVARIEVIQTPPTISAQESPGSVISMDGYYTQYFVQTGYVFRIDFQPDDVGLLALVKNEAFKQAKYPVRVEPVNIDVVDRPAYTSIFFFACEDLLR